MDAGLLGLRGGQPGPEPGNRVAATCRSSHTHTPAGFISVFSQTRPLYAHRRTYANPLNVSRWGYVQLASARSQTHTQPHTY